MVIRAGLHQTEHAVIKTRLDLPVFVAIGAASRKVIVVLRASVMALRGCFFRFPPDWADKFNTGSALAFHPRDPMSKVRHDGR